MANLIKINNYLINVDCIKYVEATQLKKDKYAVIITYIDGEDIVIEGENLTSEYAADNILHKIVNYR